VVLYAFAPEIVRFAKMICNSI